MSVSVNNIACQIYYCNFRALTKKGVEEILTDENLCLEIQEETKQLIILLQIFSLSEDKKPLFFEPLYISDNKLALDLPHPREWKNFEISAEGKLFNNSRLFGILDTIIYFLFVVKEDLDILPKKDHYIDIEALNQYSNEIAFIDKCVKDFN